MGVNQSHEGVRAAQSLINLALMTGNIGRPGTGANSITGQCNAMGSRVFSNTTNLLGGRDFTKADDRATVAKILNIDAARIPAQNSLSYHEIVNGIHAGKIKGLWVVATNSAHSWIHQQSFVQAAEKLQFLVVQDMYASTETAALADLVLPAAGWGEKEGTFINSERRIGLLKKVARAPGEALSDFAIFKLIAHYWGCAPMFERWESPEAVFQILKELSRGQPCDFSGIRDYQSIDELGGIQWPLPEGAGAVETERRLFADGTFYHANGRARFCCEAPRPMPEAPDAEYPLLLITGRGSVAQWHTQTRTAKSPVLRQLYPEGIYAEINPADAQAFRIVDGAPVTVESRRGKLKAAAFVSHAVQSGQIFIPMHYAETNRLTFAAFDPYSKQPSYKACAVKISPWLG
jgi:assimilatory nitrate reductase catalytic subunit